MKKTMMVLTVFWIAAAQLSAQVAQRVQRAPDGVIRMTFAARPEVCGDGTFIGEDTPRGFRMYSFRDNGYNVQTLEDVQPACATGPVRLVVTKAAGRVTDLDAAVGVNWRTRSNATDLGLVPAAEAASWLLDLAERGFEDRIQTVAFVAANAADSARLAERLLGMVRGLTLSPEKRAQALRWAAEAARREGRADDADRTIRSVIRDETDATVVRDRAIRELDVTAANDAFLRESYRTIREVMLRDRILRSLGTSKSEQNASWVRGVAADAGEDRRLRDRALRVLAEQMGRREDVRSMMAMLEDHELKDRALRLAFDPSDPAADQFLRDVALDGKEAVEVRDRAIRLLAERRATSADLAALYDRMTVVSLKQRIVRLLAERADDVALDKLIQLADRETNAEQRRYVLRRLSESRSPKVRTFLENKVVR